MNNDHSSWKVACQKWAPTVYWYSWAQNFCALCRRRIRRSFDISTVNVADRWCPQRRSYFDWVDWLLSTFEPSLLEYSQKKCYQKKLAVVIYGASICDKIEFMSIALKIINTMLIDMRAAIAWKDYEDRRNRQMQGIARAKVQGKYSGRRKNTEKRKIIASLLKLGYSYSERQNTIKCLRQLIAVIVKEVK